ncbi:Magnesium/proton exchanger [Zea mays]|uniref:Magnesium/proton exchanger n=1 Tax=Zea mays TaxID=4577 RepID=A0A1D6ITN9_MAIZE|nr:Magnesium/proton exchanger [Zea mays]
MPGQDGGCGSPRTTAARTSMQRGGTSARSTSATATEASAPAASGGAAGQSHPFPWQDAAISEPYYFLHLLAFFSYFAVRSTTLSADDGGELHDHLLRREIQAVLVFLLLFVVKGLSMFGKNGSGTKYHYNEIISYLDLFIPGSLSGRRGSSQWICTPLSHGKFKFAYCFVGLSAVIACFFKSIEQIMRHSREVVVGVDPRTGAPVVRRDKVWNYTIADIALLAFGTNFPQISLATIDAIRNLGQLTAGGLGPGTLIGSMAFDLFLIHAVCVVMPRAGSKMKISDLGIWLVELFWSFWAYIWLYVILEVRDTITSQSRKNLSHGHVLHQKVGCMYAISLDREKPEQFASLFEKYLGFNVAGAGSTPLHYAACGGNVVYCQVCAAISARGERPEDWVPPEDVSAVYYAKCDGIDETLPMGADGNDGIVDIFSAHSYYDAAEYSQLAEEDMEGSSTMDQVVKNTQENMSWLSIWWQQFVDASMITVQRTEQNNPLGLEVQLHITEVVCPALSEPGLRAFLPFMTGVSVCLNRGDIDPKAQQ